MSVVARRTVPLKRADPALSIGTRIYAYKHLLTKQVVYSVHKTLDSTSAIKQLAYSGKKSLPTAIRKDHWKPFFTVRFGIAKQGLRALHKLREWRYLHEYAWDQKEAEQFIATQRGITKENRKTRGKEELKDKGHKELKKIRERALRIHRSKYISDQAANSVADLAAVLVEQELLADKYQADLLKKGPRQVSLIAAALQSDKEADAQIKLLEAYREGSKRALSDAAKAASGRKKRTSLMERLQGKTHGLKLKIQKWRGLRTWVLRTYATKVAAKLDKAFLQLSTDEREIVLRDNYGLGRRRIEQLLAGLPPPAATDAADDDVDEDALAILEEEEAGSVMQESSNVDAETTSQASEKKSGRNPGGLQELQPQMNAAPQLGDLAESVVDVSRPVDETEKAEKVVARQTRLPALPLPENSIMLTKPNVEAAPTESQWVEVKSKFSGTFYIERTWAQMVQELIPEIRSHMVLGVKDEMRMSDVVVEWSDTADAEYAELWPGDVKHVPMGFAAGHTAPELEPRRLGIADRYEYDDKGRLLSHPDTVRRGPRPASVINHLRQLPEEERELLLAPDKPALFEAHA